MTVVSPATSRIGIILAGFLLSFLLSRNHALVVHAAAASPPPPPSFSFDFSNASDYSLQDIRFEGDAALNGDVVDLTYNSDDLVCKFCKGRMSYNNPVPLYDLNTGEVANFSTTFTFAINMLPNETRRGDGMAFFFSGYPSALPPGSASSVFGLMNMSMKNTTVTGADRFIAVEFDTYYNHEWDPKESSDHIGIDVNSISSDCTARLPSYTFNGTMTATITFDGTTRTLEATLHFDYNHSLAPAVVRMQLPDKLDALLPREVSVGFSAGTGAYSELHQIHSWSFNSTGTSPKAKETPTWANSTLANKVQPEQGQVVGTKDRHGSFTSSIIGGAIVIALALMVIIWTIISWYRWKRMRDSFGMDSRLKRFQYRDLSIATNRFSDKKKIRAGGFGVVYSGSLKADKQVAVKMILRDSRGESKDFLAELDAIGRTGHCNVVKLEGWCCSINNFMFWCLHKQKIKLFLVYELVPNGNLDQHLHGKSEALLPWATRFKIIKGIGSALQYLHHQCKPCILHRDIKPSNILLDHDFNAKLGDFGLSRIGQYDDDTSMMTVMAVGTADYMDPLCKKNGQVKLRASSDVYSFGIVVLEIAHGANNLDLVRRLYTDQPETFAKDVADKKLDGQFDKTEMERVIVLALQCSERDESQRPSMAAAMLFLENGGELPLATPDRSTPLAS